MIQDCKLTIPERIFRELKAHLFPGDGDEHGAVILAGLSIQNGRARLLARELFCAKDGIDYIEGQRGYRMLKAQFIHPLIRRCGTERLCYLAIHNHGGTFSVGFSRDDLDSHERGYPALLDIAEGMPIGALVLARNSIAGDIWISDGRRLPLSETRVIGATISRVYDRPQEETHGGSWPQHDRQLLMFGEKGQRLLKSATIGIVGAGGVGSLLVEYLARLGIGHLIVIDPDQIDPSNLSRVVGATRGDALTWLRKLHPASWIQRLATHFAKKKVAVAQRVARQANPDCIVDIICGDFSIDSNARRFLECDFLFLAADSMRARLAFNAICQQYFIPGIQIGSKIVPADKNEGLENAFSVTRWITPGEGCLWCSQAISPHILALEAKSEQERKDQNYGTSQANPSVISLNAMGASSAVNDFLFSFLNMFDVSVKPWSRRYSHVKRSIVQEVMNPDNDCSECSNANHSRFGRGDSVPLPTLAGG